MIQQGKVHSVESYPAGGKVVQDYAAGSTVLEVSPILDFQEAGGMVTILDSAYSYVLNLDAETLTITPALPVAIDDGEDVLVYPASREKRAYVRVDDGEDAIIAAVPHALQDDFDEGIREETERETVLLEEVRGSWMVQNIVALDPLSGQMTRQALQDAAAALVAAGAAQGTADTALASANGKNAVTHADYAPTNESNTAGDTWYVHSTEAGEEGRIIAQFQGLGGTSWGPSQISHQVIASVDLGTATVGRLAANYLETGVLSAALTLTGYILAGNPTGARVVIDADGLRQYAADGSIVINLPTDPLVPAQFEGTGIFDALTVKDNFILQGLASEISRGAVLSVAAGTSAPLAPSVAVGYETYMATQWNYLYTPAGMHSNTDNTSDFNAVSTFFGYAKFLGKAGRYHHFPTYTNSAGNGVHKYGNVACGVGIHTAAGAERFVTYSNYTSGNGAVTTGTIDVWDMDTMNSSGTVAPALKAHLNAGLETYTFSVRLGRVFSGVGSTTLKERIAMVLWNIDGTVYGANKLTLRQYSIADSGSAAPGVNAGFTQIGSNIVITNPRADNAIPIGVTHGMSDKLGFPGAAQYVWLLHFSDKTYAYNSNATSRLTEFDFPTPAGGNRMFANGDVATNEFIGFRTTEHDDASPITKLTNNHWVSPTSSKRWFSVSAYDSDITGGTHETAQGQRASITAVKRAGFVITTPAYAARPFPTTTDDPLSFRVYFGSGATDPGRTYMERIGELNSPNRVLTLGNVALLTAPAASPPPAASDFPASSPGRLQSADGAGWVLSGDGKATLAGVEFDGAKPGFLSSVMRAQEFRYSDSSVGTTTNTTGTTANARGGQGTFVAPPSGSVRLDWSGLCKSSVAGSFANCTIEVKTGSTIGSGTVILGHNANDGALNYGTDYVTVSQHVVLSGLTPGDTYNTRNVIYCSGGTMSYTRLRILVTPLP